MRQKANALDNRGCSDNSGLRIFWVGFWELNRTNRYLRSDRENLHIGSTFLHTGIEATTDFDSLFTANHAISQRLIAERASGPDLRAARIAFLAFGDSFSGAIRSQTRIGVS